MLWTFVDSVDPMSCVYIIYILSLCVDDATNAQTGDLFSIYGVAFLKFQNLEGNCVDEDSNDENDMSLSVRRKKLNTQMYCK